MRKSWQNSPPNYAEPAISIVRDLVAAHRESGTKTFAALELVAPEVDVNPRRLRRLFERERVPVVRIDEYTRLLLLGARVLRRLIDRQRERADRWEAEADLLELRHRQLTLWGGECGESTGGAVPRGRAA